MITTALHLGTGPLLDGWPEAFGAGLPASPWDHMIDLGVPAWEKVVRTVLVYGAILVLIRVAGKRLMAQMNSLDLVVVLLLSNVVQAAIIGPDTSVVGGIIGAVVLVGLNAGLDRVAQVSLLARRVLEGSPTVVVRDGRLDEGALARLGLNSGELDTALRRQGAHQLSDAARATLAPGGLVTVDLRPDSRAASHADLQQAVDQLTAAIEAIGAQRSG